MNIVNIVNNIVINMAPPCNKLSMSTMWIVEGEVG